MARLPPPSAGSVVLLSSALLARLGIGALDGQVIDLGALERRPHRGVGVDAEEHVGADGCWQTPTARRATSCDRLRASGTPSGRGGFRSACATGARPTSVISFSSVPLAPCVPSSSPPWPGIDHHRAQARRRSLRGNHQPRVWRAASGAGVGAASVVAGSRSIVRRPEPASACDVVTRCMAVARPEASAPRSTACRRA